MDAAVATPAIPRALTPGAPPKFALELRGSLDAARPSTAPMPPRLQSLLATPGRGRDSRQSSGGLHVREESPTKRRVKNLSGRISDLQAGIEEEKLARREAWEAQLKKLEDHLEVVAVSDEPLFKAWKEQVRVIRTNLDTEKQALVMMGDRHKEVTAATERNLTSEITQHTETRKDNKERQRKSMVQPEARILEDLKLSKESREEGERRRDDVLAAEMAALTKDAATLPVVREGHATQFQQHLADEIARLQERLAEERKTRELAEMQMRSQVDDILGGLKNQISEQRQKRIAMEETMLKLLEEITNKVEAGIERAA